MLVVILFSVQLLFQEFGVNSEKSHINSGDSLIQSELNAKNSDVYPQADETISSANDLSDKPRYTMVFRGTALSTALQEIAGETGTDIVFDPAIVSDIAIYAQVRNLTVSEILQEVLRESGLDYITLSTGTVVIVKSSRSPNSTGTLSGRVVDERTGQPLPGATVLLVDAKGGTATNQSGFFSFPDILSGPHEIIVSYLGYAPERRVIEIPVGGEVREVLALSSRTMQADPVVITGHNQRLSLTNGNGESLSTRDASGFTRSADAMRNLGVFSGIQFQLPLADMHIQGGNSNDHRYYLDGIPVYYPYSFGQMFSAFSPFAIGRVSVHKAGFDASEGSQISGLVHLTHDATNATSNRLTAHADPVAANIRADLDASTQSLNIRNMVAFRSNFWDLYASPSLSSSLQRWDYIDPIISNQLFNANDAYGMYDASQHQSDIRFYDLHLSSKIELDAFQTILATFYSGQNSVETNVLNRQITSDPHYADYMFGRDFYDWENMAARLRYERMLTARTDLAIQTSYSSNTMQHLYSMAHSNDEFFRIDEGRTEAEVFDIFANALGHGMHQAEENRIQHFIMRADLTYAVNRNTRISGGLQADRVETMLNWSDLFYIPAASRNTAWMTSGYISTDIFPAPQWHINAGSRLTWVGNTDTFYAEPRMSVQYDRGESIVGAWSVRLAGGLYRQFVNQLSISNPGPSAIIQSVPIWTHAGELNVPKAWHGTASFLIEPVRDVSVKLESFLKWQPITHYTSYRGLLLSENEHLTSMSDFTEQTRSIQYGAGITLNSYLEYLRTDFLLGYDYTVSRIDMEFQFGGWMMSPWSEPHRLRGSVRTRLNESFSITTGLAGSFGRRWAFRQAYYDYLMMHNRHQFGNYSFTNPEEDRLPAFIQLDAGIHYNHRIGGTRIRTQLDVINVLNRRNTVDYSLMPAGTGEADSFRRHARTLPGFYPAFSIQLSL